MLPYDIAPAAHQEYHAITDEKQIYSIKQTAFTMMSQLEGWCSYDKAAILIDLVLQIQPKVIVEIGVFGGKSLVPMAYAQQTLGIGKTYGIDPWDNNESVVGIAEPINRNWWGTLDHNYILKGLIDKIHAFHLEDQIELIKKSSAAAPLITEIDMLHIDGNHSEITSFFDVMKWVPLVRPGGWILFDDIHWFENGKNTTGAAVKWLNEHCVKCAEINDAAPWGIWMKPLAKDSIGEGE